MSQKIHHHDPDPDETIQDGFSIKPRTWGPADEATDKVVITHHDQREEVPDAVLLAVLSH